MSHFLFFNHLCRKSNQKNWLFYISFWSICCVPFWPFFWLMNDKFCMIKNLSGFLEFVIFEFYVFVHEIFDWMQYEIKLIWIRIFFEDFSLHFAKHFFNWSWLNPRWTKFLKTFFVMYSMRLFTCSVFAIFMAYFWNFFN